MSTNIPTKAVTSAQRLSQLPEVPTVAEAIPGYELAGWQAVFVAAKTPVETVNALSAELRKITYSPEIMQRLKADSMTPIGNSPEQIKQAIASEQAIWGQTMKARNIRLD